MIYSGKGGARHFSKPKVDEGILLKIFANHGPLLSDFGAYESISRNQACHPQGLIHVLGLVNALVAVEKSCEIHQGAMRAAMARAYQEEPSLNQTKFRGGVWVGLKVERLNVILYHMRRLKKSDQELRVCSSKLPSADFIRLQQVLDLIDKKKPAVLTTSEPALDQRDSTAKRLKKEVSDVSLGSEGYPKCWQTPAKKENDSPLSKGRKENDSPLSKGRGSPLSKGELGSNADGLLEENAAEQPRPLTQPSFLRRRLGKGPAKHAQSPASGLKEQLGFVHKKPAALAKSAKKRPSSQQDVAQDNDPTSSGARLKWVKLNKTHAKKPERAYITGTHVAGGKMKLVVEISRARSIKYAEHIDTILCKLNAKNLTKEEAIQLRETLCKQD